MRCDLACRALLHRVALRNESCGGAKQEWLHSAYACLAEVLPSLSVSMGATVLWKHSIVCLSDILEVVMQNTSCHVIRKQAIICLGEIFLHSASHQVCKPTKLSIASWPSLQVQAADSD